MLHQIGKQSHVLVKQRCHAHNLTRVVANKEAVIARMAVHVHADGIHDQHLSKEFVAPMLGKKREYVIDAKPLPKHTNCWHEAEIF